MHCSPWALQTADGDGEVEELATLEELAILEETIELEEADLEREIDDEAKVVLVEDFVVKLLDGNRSQRPKPFWQVLTLQ